MRQDAVTDRLDESTGFRQESVGPGDLYSAAASTLLEVLVSGRRVSLATACDQVGGQRALDGMLEAWEKLAVPVSRQDGHLLWSPSIPVLSAAEISRQLTAQGLACEVQVEFLTDSTNARLLRAVADAAVAPPCVLLAECQQAGRGRRQRAWQARFGEAILMSVLLQCPRPPAELPGVAIVAGLALHRALADLGVEGLALKWPNDVLLHDAKLAGILVESTGRGGQIVVGIGINWSGAEGLSRRLERPVAALQAALPADPGRSRVAAAVVLALVEDVQRFSDAGLQSFLPAFARHDALSGRTVRVSTADTMSRYGTACGLAADGGLKVDHGGALAVYHSAEVSVVLA